MDIYTTSILASLVVYAIVGNYAGRKVKHLEDYFVVGRQAPTLLIVGAGIAGLSAALAVSRTGFNVVICERTSELTELGAGIQLSPNAGRVLAGLGLDDAIAEAAIERGVEPDAS